MKLRVTVFWVFFNTPSQYLYHSTSGIEQCYSSLNHNNVIYINNMFVYYVWTRG